MSRRHRITLFALFWLVAGLVVPLALVGHPRLWQKQAVGMTPAFGPLLNTPTPSPAPSPFLGAAQDFAPHQLIVKFKPLAQAAALSALQADKEVLSTREVRQDVVLVSLADDVDPAAKASSLETDPAVAYAEPNFIYHPLLIPSDSRFPEQWGLTKIAAPSAWDLSTGQDAVTIAILDTGIDRTHPDLTGRVIGDTDVVGEHGTTVAGVVAALTNNNAGIAALPFSRVTLDSHVICIDASTCYAADIASGIDRAVAKNERIILIALGGPTDSSLVREAVQSATFLGALIVSAAGNSGAADLVYPAAYPQVLSVAATDPFDRRAVFSNYGSWVDVAAPGQGIVTTGAGAGFEVVDGTSAAAGFAASLAGLLLSADSTLTGPQLRGIIQTATDSVGFSLRYGRINAQKALSKLIAPTSTPPPTPTPTVAPLIPSPTVTVPGGPVAPPATPIPEPTFVTAPECQGINPLTDPFCALLEIPKLFYLVMLFLQYLAAFLFVVFLVAGGFLWLKAGDDPRQLAQAHLTLFWALVGLVTVFSLRLFAKVLASFVAR